MSEPSDPAVLAAEEAQRLAEAETNMRAAAEQAKAARLPSAIRAVEVLTGNAITMAVSILREAIACNVDDLPRVTGAQGTEGTKQTLQRIVTSYDNGVSMAQDRVTALQPTPAPAPAPEAPDQTEA